MNDVKFCFKCEDTPCESVGRIDRRYRKQYAMRVIDNLKELKENGMKTFLEIQEGRYECSKCGDVISVRDRRCYSCG